MAADFTVGALAIAARRANAVGAVRITCARAGLEIELVRVAGFAPGFAVGAVAEPVRFRVPYVAVRGLVRRGRLLYLGLDPTYAIPHSRFALARFTDDPADALARAYLARAVARWASWLVPAPLGLLAMLLAPEGLAAGALGRGALGVLVGFATWAALRELVAWRTWGGPLSDRLRDAFEIELADRLGLTAERLPRPLPPPLPPPARLPPPPPRTAPGSWPAPPPLVTLPPPAPTIPGAPLLQPAPVGLSRARRKPAPPAPAPESPATPALPSVPERPRLGRPALAVLAAALGAVGVMAFLQRYAGERPAPPAVEWATTGIAAAVRSIDVGEWPPDPKPERCLCMRAESPLWEDGIARVSVLTFGGEEDASAPPVSAPDRRGRPRFSFDLAVVNNGARPAIDTAITVTFARRNKKNERVGATDKGLFWGGPLHPGRAARWHVTGPGTELRIDMSIPGTLDEARLEPAPADAFFALTGSRYRAVRLHAAMMLAYVRDARADEVARALSAQGAGGDELLVGRIRRAAAPVITCAIDRREDRLSACVFNGSAEPRSGLALREVAGDAGAGRTFPIKETIPVHDGVRVSFPVESAVEGELAITP